MSIPKGVNYRICGNIVAEIYRKNLESRCTSNRASSVRPIWHDLGTICRVSIPAVGVGDENT